MSNTANTRPHTHENHQNKLASSTGSIARRKPVNYDGAHAPIPAPTFGVSPQHNAPISTTATTSTSLSRAPTISNNIPTNNSSKYSSISRNVTITANSTNSAKPSSLHLHPLINTIKS